MEVAAKTLTLTIAILLLTSIPYVYATLSSPGDMVYTGLMIDVPDHAQYWSWVTASRDGLFISNTMTPEPNPPIFMNPMMWLLARVQLLFGLSFPVLFQVWRAGATVLFVAALLIFIGTVARDADKRRTALMIALLSSGFGCFLILAKKLMSAADVPWPVDLYTVEPNTFWGLLAYPYLPLGQALILFAMTGVWLVHQGNRQRGLALAGLGSLLLALTHPYDLIVLYAVLGAFGLSSWIRTRTFPLGLFWVGLVIVVCSGPMALYYRSLTVHDPLWRSILAQYANAGVWTPKHFHLVILMGMPLLLAAIGLFPPRPRDESRWFVGTWAIVQLGLIYLPTVYQIKLLAGWQVPLAVLAADAWHDRFVPRFAPLAQRIGRAARPITATTLSRAALLCLIVPTNAYLFAWRFVELRRHQSPYYLHRDELAALDWLARRPAGREVVIAPSAIGQFVPNYGRSRAYLAHWAMTNRFYERRDNVARFFSNGTADEWRDRLMRREGVTMVLRAGTTAELESMFDPSRSPLFREVLTLPRAQLFEFRDARR